MSSKEIENGQWAEGRYRVKKKQPVKIVATTNLDKTQWDSLTNRSLGAMQHL